MKCVLFLVCLFLTCLHLQAKDLVVGSRVNNLLVSTEKLVYQSIPLYRRDKDYVYVDTKLRVIKIPTISHWCETRPRGVHTTYHSYPDEDSLEQSKHCRYLNQRYFNGIIARDLSRTKAEVTVTSGGVGYTNVTLHFKSERGEGLNYLILIFSLNS